MNLSGPFQGSLSASLRTTTLRTAAIVHLVELFHAATEVICFKCVSQL